MLIQFYRYLVINQRTGQIETLTRRCRQMKSESKSPSKWWNDISIHRAMLLETNKHDMTATEVFYKQKGAKGHWSWELVPSIQLSF